MKPILDWLTAHPYLVAYVLIGALGALAKLRWTSPAGQAFAKICGAIGLGIQAALPAGNRTPPSIQDDIPTNPEMVKSLVIITEKRDPS